MVTIDNNTVLISGIIGWPEWLNGDESAVSTKEKMRAEIAVLQQFDHSTMRLEIDSFGGDVTHAIAIVNAIKASGAAVEVVYVGWSASAATIIGASFDNVSAYENVQLLMHEGRGMTAGTKNTVASYAEWLEKTNTQMADIYAAKSGKDKTEVLAIMSENNGEGTWRTASEMHELGIVDTVLPAMAAAANFDAETANKLNIKLPKTESDMINFFSKKPERTATNGGVLLHSGELKVGAEVTTGSVIEGSKENADGVYNTETQSITVEGGKVTDINAIDTEKIQMAADLAAKADELATITARVAELESQNAELQSKVDELNATPSAAQVPPTTDQPAKDTKRQSMSVHAAILKKQREAREKHKNQ